MNNALIGIFIKILSVACVLMLAALVKTYPVKMPVSELVFFRVIMALPFVLIFILVQNNFDRRVFVQKIRPNNIWLHIRRSFLGMTSMALIFISVRLLPLPIANALKELSPIFITLLAALFLGETIRIYRTTGLLLGVFGVALISYQTIVLNDAITHAPMQIWGVMAALTAALTVALAQVQIRSMVATEHPTAIVFWFFIFTALISVCFLPFGWHFPQGREWLWLFGMGLMGAGGQLGITIAYRYADASTIAPFEYFSIPLALLVGGFAFGEWPKLLSLIGMGFILVGGVIIIYREGQIARQNRKEKSL